jgi:hypothetical protein
VELDVDNLTFANSKHHYTTAAIEGELHSWNKLFKRWEESSFCVTRSGYLMRFEGTLDTIEKGNLYPNWSINLTTTVLGDLERSPGGCTFTLLADKYIHEAHSYSGPIKLVNGPIKLAKHTMSKFRTFKFGVDAEQAQEWHEIIGSFAQKRKEPLLSLRKLRPVKNVFGQKQPSARAPGRALVIDIDDDDDDDDDDEDDEDDEVQSSAVSSYSGPPSDSEWEKRAELAAVEEKPVRKVAHTIADGQPVHITHNPW